MNAPITLSNVPQPIRLKVEDFLLLDESGAFDDFCKTELIEGEIIGMNAQFSRHSRAKLMLARQLADWADQSGSGLEALSEVSVRLSDSSMPEPDILLTSYHGDDFVPVETVRLLVEVADTTLDIDLGRKLRIYAEAGVPEYWVVDLDGGRVVRMWEPLEDGFLRRNEVRIGDQLESMTISDLTAVVQI